MRHLERIIQRGPRRIALLGGIVLLPAIALGLLAFRTFQGERGREEYQRRAQRAAAADPAPARERFEQLDPVPLRGGREGRIRL